MKIKKLFNLIIVISLVLSTFIISIDSVRAVGLPGNDASWKDDSSSDMDNQMGLKISLIDYNYKTKTESRVSTVYLLTRNLLKERKITAGGPVAQNASQVHAGLGITGQATVGQDKNNNHVTPDKNNSNQGVVRMDGKNDYGIKQQNNNAMRQGNYTYDQNLGIFKLGEKKDKDYSMAYNYSGCPMQGNLPGGNVNITSMADTLSAMQNVPIVGNVINSIVSGIVNSGQTNSVRKYWHSKVPANYLAGKYVRYTLSYTTGQHRIIYKGGEEELGKHIVIPKEMTKNKIRWAEDYGLTITKSDINSGSLSSKIKPGLFANLEAAESFFNYKIAANAIERYYIEVIGIKRVFYNKNNTPSNIPKPEHVGTYLASSVTETTAEPEPGGSVQDSTLDTNLYCSEGVKREKNVFNGYYCSKDSDDVESCTLSSTNTCSEGCTRHENEKKWNCKEADAYHLKEFSNWSTMHCGVKVTHNIYGNIYNGYSELVFTKEGSDNCSSTSPYTGLADKADEENEHCKIKDGDSKYTLNEKGNSCAGESAYYIGPDPKRAMVGESAKNEDNRYGIIGSGSSKDCYKGVKHYFVMDLDSKADKLCETVCKRASSDKTSNTYLKCAENFCDNDVDETRAADSYLRKRNCILNSCGYKYGQVPQMNGGAGSASSQSVSSCANMPIYKNGKDPYYDKNKNDKELSVTSECGAVDGQSISSKEKRIAVCYNNGGTDSKVAITDYNGSDSGDIILDERRYINIACEEVAKVEEVSNINTTYNPGDPIPYKIRTTKSIECTAWFDYEQWKVDYAVIPSFDVLRRNKMLFTYYVFNNMLDSKYENNLNAINPDVIFTEGKTVKQYSTIPYFRAKPLGSNTFTDLSLLQHISDYPYGRIDISKYMQLESTKIFNGTATDSVRLNPNKQFNGHTETLIDDYSNLGLGDFYISKINFKDLKLSSGYTSKNASTNKLTKVVKNNISSVPTGNSETSEMVAYKITSKAAVEYVYHKYCVEGGTVKQQDYCSTSGTKGENVFYVPPSASKTNGPEDKIVGETTIKSQLPQYSGKEMYKDTDTCNFAVSGPIPNYRCNCEVIEGLEVNDNYYTPVRVKMNITKYNTDNTNTPNLKVTLKSSYRNETVSGNIFDLKMSDSAQKYGLEDITAEGEYINADGQPETCTCAISLITMCTNECTVDKSVKGGVQIKTTVSNQAIVKGGFSLARFTQDNKGYPEQLQQIRETTIDGHKGYFAIDASNIDVKNANPNTNLADGAMKYAWGYVKNETAPGCFCPPEIPTTCKKTPKYPDAGLYWPGERNSIETYCYSDFEKDSAGYANPTDCYNDCAYICPRDTKAYPYIAVEKTKDDIEKNKSVIEKYCNDYHNLGFKDNDKMKAKDICRYAVYQDCINKGTVEYRPVNVNNPFPYAVDNERITENTYESGDRPVGSNWMELEYVITKTNIYAEPKYRLTLDLDTINSIKSYGKEIQGNYTLGKNSGYSSKGYKSELVNNTLQEKFCYKNGVKRKDC